MCPHFKKSFPSTLPGILLGIIFYLSWNLKFVFTNRLRRHKMKLRIEMWRGVSYAY
jgi:putative flippase GtrA